MPCTVALHCAVALGASEEGVQVAVIEVMDGFEFVLEFEEPPPHAVSAIASSDTLRALQADRLPGFPAPRCFQKAITNAARRMTIPPTL